jgi:hypothetical protein
MALEMHEHGGDIGDFSGAFLFYHGLPHLPENFIEEDEDSEEFQKEQEAAVDRLMRGIPGAEAVFDFTSHTDWPFTSFTWRDYYHEHWHADCSGSIRLSPPSEEDGSREYHLFSVTCEALKDALPTLEELMQTRADARKQDEEQRELRERRDDESGSESPASGEDAAPRTLHCAACWEG